MKNKKECSREMLSSRINSEKKEWVEVYKRLSADFSAAKKKLGSLDKILRTIEAFRYFESYTRGFGWEIPRFLSNLERVEAQLKELHEKIVAFKRN
ncbi:hypothetical protein HYT92_01590 [Candidatus Pacearchaeota archaeon]|nr:hypothetical protein [Candidatus Pacearchaeota archaeon]